VLLFVMNGLAGLDEAVHGVYPKAEIQHCIVHKVRSSIKNFRKKDLSAFTTDLKAVYESSNMELAKSALDELSQKWGKSYRKVVDS